jgi:hypothetical protein
MIFIKNITTIKEKPPLPGKKTPQQPTPPKPHFQEQSWVSSKNNFNKTRKIQNTHHSIGSLHNNVEFFSKFLR